ncbi:MAG: SPFH domain-containing protein [Cystobacter sp.]
MEVLILCGVVGGVGVCALLLRSYRRVGADEALVLLRGGEPTRVCRERGWGWPLLYQTRVLDLSVRKVLVERRGRRGLSCRDGIRVDVRATFLVGVPRTEAAVLRVAREVGCERARQPGAVQALLEERLAGGLAHSVGTFNFDELVADRSLFIDHVGVEVGDDLWGFRLERLSLGRLEQTPLDQLDPTNEQDARGIQTLSERASPVAVRPEDTPWSDAPREAPREREGRQEEWRREVDRVLEDRTRRG